MGSAQSLGYFGGGDCGNVVEPTKLPLTGVIAGSSSAMGRVFQYSSFTVTPGTLHQKAQGVLKYEDPLEVAWILQ